MSRRLTWKTALALCVVPGAARAGEIPQTFTLGRYVPDTCWLYIHGVHNPERAYIEQQWSKVFNAFLHSGIDQEVKNLLTTLLPEEERAEFEQQWTRITELCKAVSWGDLAGREFVYAMQLSPVPTYLFLCQGTPGTGKKNAAALAEILEHLASLEDTLQLRSMPCQGGSRSCLVIPGAPLCIDLFQRDDLVGISTCTTLTRRVLSLMAGEGEVGPIVECEGFRRALTAVPDPEDSLTYLDFRSLASDLRSLLEGLFAKAGESPDAVRARRIVLSILERLNVFDYLLAVQHTEGHQERAYTVAALQPDCKETRFAKVFANRKPLDKPYRFIPAEATNFSVSVGVDLDAAYALILDIIRHDVPDGDLALEAWNQTQDEYAFHVQEDVLDWFSGEMITVTLPAARPTLFSYTDQVLMLRVKDPTLAAQKVNAAIARLKDLLRQHFAMELVETPAAVTAPGFRTLSYPPLIVLAQPVIGVYKEWLIVGGSVEAINACLATAEGRGPSILEAERFRKEGILRDQPVSSASFTDLSNLQQELAGIFQAMGICGSMASQIIGQKDKQSAKVLESVMAMVHRLAPVVAQIDFYSSTATYCTFDGLAWKVEMLTTYKAPRPAGQ